MQADAVVVGRGTGRRRDGDPSGRAGALRRPPRPRAAFPVTRSAASTSRRRGAGSWTASASSPGWRRVGRGRSGGCASSRPTAPSWSVTTRPTAVARTSTHALAVRRRALDLALVERAREAGVSVREGMRVVDLLREGRRVTGVVAEPTGAGGADRRSAPSRPAGRRRRRPGVGRRPAARAPAPASLAPPARARRRRGGRVRRPRARRDRPRAARLLDPESGRRRCGEPEPRGPAWRRRGAARQTSPATSTARRARCPGFASDSAAPAASGRSAPWGPSPTTWPRRARTASSSSGTPPGSSIPSPARASTRPSAPPRSRRRSEAGP